MQFKKNKKGIYEMLCIDCHRPIPIDKKKKHGISDKNGLRGYVHDQPCVVCIEKRWIIKQNLLGFFGTRKQIMNQRQNTYDEKL